MPLVAAIIRTIRLNGVIAAILLRHCLSERRQDAACKSASFANARRQDILARMPLAVSQRVFRAQCKAVAANPKEVRSSLASPYRARMIDVRFAIGSVGPNAMQCRTSQLGSFERHLNNVLVDVESGDFVERFAENE